VGFGNGAIGNFFRRHRSIFTLGLMALVLAAMADLGAGIFLSNMEDYLIAVPGMMVLIYSAISMRGMVFGAMGSRLGTSMHMGTFDLSFKKGSVLRSNIESGMVLTLFMSLLIGIVGWLVVQALFATEARNISIVDFTFISMLGGTLAGMAIITVNILVAYIGFKKDWDVDNITAPIIAAAGDVITIPMVFVATWMYFNVPRLVNWSICAVLVAIALVTFFMVAMRRDQTTGRRRIVDEAKRIVVQSLPILFVCLLLEICAGVIIENKTETFVSYAVLLVLLPAFLNEGNALSGMLTARLSTKLHMGTMDAKPFPPKEAYDNFATMYILAGITFAVIFLAAYAIAPPTLPFGTVFAIVMLAGLIATTVINVLSYYVATLAVRFNLDPDDHCIPITSATMDIACALILTFVIGLFV